ncbi:MAG: DMT family transporter [Rhodospirillaceae bacterium]|nr:DMT family transporter [Rhodospirillaceae bacterium]
MTRSTCNPALLALFAGIFLSGFSPILVRLSPLDPAATACWRLLVAALLSLIFARLKVALPPRVLLAVIFAGFLLAADLVLWNIAIMTTTVMEAALLVMLYPLLVAAVEIIFLRRPLGWQLVAGGLIAFTGVAVMTAGPSLGSFGSGQSSTTGNLLALTAAFFYAGCLLITARSCRGHDVRAVTFWELISAGLFCIPLLFWEDHGVPVDAGETGFMALYGLITFAGYYLMNIGLTRISASVAAVLGYGQPVIASVIAFFLLREVPSGMALAGGVTVLFGLAFASRAARAPVSS